jgi:hypothetical protein
MRLLATFSFHFVFYRLVRVCHELYFILINQMRLGGRLPSWFDCNLVQIFNEKICLWISFKQ